MKSAVEQVRENLILNDKLVEAANIQPATDIMNSVDFFNPWTEDISAVQKMNAELQEMRENFRPLEAFNEGVNSIVDSMQNIYTFQDYINELELTPTLNSSLQEIIDIYANYDLEEKTADNEEFAKEVKEKIKKASKVTFKGIVILIRAFPRLLKILYEEGSVSQEEIQEIIEKCNREFSEIVIELEKQKDE
ncbi:hypothetical protein [Alkalicoccus chagannorensis]|uniref:hypothetical protein n=1 Tax=Alkalicoccus chagannorensis TaxID=427072 RepID=UPI0004283734|nr:hypothetical protein [Alkalicoccus chagannorensis]